MKELKIEYYEIKKSDLLKEDKIETALMVAGFVPVIGEIADTVLIIRYLIKGEILFAVIMLIALVPTVGDIIAKPLILALKGAKWALKSPQMLTKFLIGDAKAAKLYKTIMGKLGDPSVTKFVTSFKRKFPKLGSKLEKGIQEHKMVYQTVMNADKAAITAGGAYSPKFVKSLKGQFASNYLIKKGIKTPNLLQRKWASYRGKRGIRNYIVKSVIGLRLLGIGNESDFEKAMSNPQTAQQLINDPQFNNIMGNADQMENQGGGQSYQSQGIPMNNDMILNVLKRYAQQYGTAAE